MKHFSDGITKHVENSIYYFIYRVEFKIKSAMITQ
jgi:hypothetical protein